MKKIIVICMVLAFGFSFAQENKENKNPVLTKTGDIILATYLNDNGTIEQQGTFNSLGELHGTWTSYDKLGNKVAVGKYEKGKKVGKWFFWTDNLLKEVDYLDSKIVSVYEWNNKSNVAIRN